MTTTTPSLAPNASGGVLASILRGTGGRLGPYDACRRLGPGMFLFSSFFDLLTISFIL